MTLARQWERCRPWLEPALRGEHAAAVAAEIEAGLAQLWPGDTAAIVTQCVSGPDGRALHVWLAGGDLVGVLALRSGVEAWGRAMGCDYVSIDGRPGWARLLRSDGYAPFGDELRKALHG